MLKWLDSRYKKKYTGEIPQPARTWSTISHANEHGVVIAETTQGGLAALNQESFRTVSISHARIFIGFERCEGTTLSHAPHTTLTQGGLVALNQESF